MQQPPPALSSLNNFDYLKNQIFNVDQAVDETEYTDQLEYIRNDVAKKTGVTNSVASIKLSDNGSSMSQSSAALVTKTDGSTLLYMWGNNEYGQLGNGTTTRTSTPTLVDSAPFGSKKITQIALGYYHSAALLEDGSLYMWGNNEYGQLGFPANTTANSTPVQVDLTPFSSKKITQIALGYYHSAALLEDGSLYMWGNNEYGKLGFTANWTPNPTPVLVTALSGKKITQISLGRNHSAAILEGGSLYMWGYNYYGELGNGTSGSSTSTSTPTPVNSTPFGANKITQIALGGNHSAALLEDGSLYMWGLNQYGQLGNAINNGTSTANAVPTLVAALNGKKITQIALSQQQSAALMADGSLYMWGYNNSGQLGNGTTDNTPTPTLVDSTPFSSRKITQIALGNYHSAALLEDGSLYMWGNNYYGQLGFTATGNNPNPTPTWMSQLGKDSHITAKSTITAKNAVDNLWVDNNFNLTGFKNSFNLINIPDVAGQTYEIATKPTYDDDTGTVTMNIKIKYYYDENGLIVADTAANPMTISGFESTIKTTEDQFPWWWIIVGIGGAAVVGLGVWLIIKKQNGRYGHRRTKSGNKSRRYR